jgi:hypothetical protein
MSRPTCSRASKLFYRLHLRDDHARYRGRLGAPWVERFRRIAVEDPVTGALSYQRLLLGAAIKLMPYAAEGKAIGVMLPNANAAAVTVVGLMSAGRVPAMINFTAGSTNILAAC